MPSDMEHIYCKLSFEQVLLKMLLIQLINVDQTTCVGSLMLSLVVIILFFRCKFDSNYTDYLDFCFSTEIINKINIKSPSLYVITHFHN